jgi:hypothetical protein
VNWHCLACEQSGETTGTESGADAKHVKAEGHATTSHLTDWNDCEDCRHLLVSHETDGPCTVRECKCVGVEESA